MTNDALLAPSSSPTPAAEIGAPVPDRTLTDRQWRILNFIRETLQRKGYPPSLREIGTAVGLSSTSSTAHQLKQLEKKGLIALDRGRPRAYRITASDSAGPAIPALRHVGCPLLTTDSGDEQADQTIVLQVVLDPAISRALLAGALLTVQQLNIPETEFSGAAVFGQVTAVSHPVASPHP